MPWELTSTLRTINSGDFTPWLNLPKIPRTLPAVAENFRPKKATDDIRVRTETIRITCQNTAFKRSDPDRAQAILKWVELILAHPSASRVGQQLLAMDAGDARSDRCFMVVSDSLQSKATATLNLRASSLALYTKWFADFFPHEQFLPFSEERVYHYLCDLRDKACSASRGSTFLHTLAFVKDRLGMLGVDEVLSSPRTQGAALCMYLEKRPLRQAPPLHPMMVLTLELAAFCEADTYLRAMSGFCLACIFGRMRISDMTRMVHLSVIGAFAEGSVMRTKTSRTREKQTTFLPVILPCRGFSGMPWFEAFLISREQLGLPEIPGIESRAHDQSFLIMPSRGSLGYEFATKVSSSEVTQCLRAILGKIFPEDQVLGLTSHSLKTTVLTYLSKFGCDLTWAELLGYHLTQHKSAINYQRDALAAPIRFMCQMLERIRLGEFEPMAARDALFHSSMSSRDVYGQLYDYTGKTMAQICESFLECSVSVQESPAGSPELARLWEILCEEPQPIFSEMQQLNENALQSLGYQHSPSGDLSEGEAVSISSQCSSEDSSDSGSSSAEEALAELSKKSGGPCVRNIAKTAVLGSYFRHCRTHMVHMGHTEASDKTACGRALGGTYTRFTGDVERAWPHCTFCFGNTTDICKDLW
eukprot:s4052_g4.t1